MAGGVNLKLPTNEKGIDELFSRGCAEEESNDILCSCVFPEEEINAVTGRHSPYSFSEEENESQHFISKEEINTTLKEFLVASLIYIGKATGTGIKFNGICYSDNEENEELLEMCKTAAKNIIALEDVETNEFQETTALAFLNKCFCRKIEQQEDLQASTNLKQLKERSTILETIHEIIYYPEKLVIKSVETLTKDIIRETESLADMKNEIFWINIKDCDYQRAIYGLNEEFASFQILISYHFSMKI
ncbi:uncharacterized protein LOC106074375 [Biomphalaria glabrata]|uniref:Uncharacterized protein LOC106074375 n=1 Tax=Biomphalaria glabrata TaxID=6526 RepID=A0A9W3B212_BIOGL|nr:uncharacterized protein LOC106074375 [Biomphalaria glabrata]